MAKDGVDLRGAIGATLWASAGATGALAAAYPASFDAMPSPVPMIALLAMTAAGAAILALVNRRDAIRREAALEDGERRFRDFAEAASDWFWEHDADRYITYLSPRVGDALGIDTERLLGKHRDRLVDHAYDREGWKRHLEDLEHHRPFRDFVFRLRTGRGDARTLKISGKPVFAADGRFAGYRGTGTDITHQKEIQARLEAMLESVGLGIGVFDDAGRLVISNREFGELLKLPVDLTRAGALYSDILRHQEQGNEVEIGRRIADAISGRSLCEELSQPDGRILQTRINPMPEGGYVTVVADLTDRKRLEQELFHSQKMDALGQLAGGVAHDFNNILSVIGGYATLARRKVPGDDDLRQHLKKIVRGVERATVLTRELLTFSRKRMVSTRVVDLAALVRDQEFLLSPLLGETIRLSLRVPDDRVLPGRVDPDLMAQAVVNLAINARDAMPGGGDLTIEVGMAAADADLPPPARPRAHVRIRVSDTGTGMDEQTLKHIFEPFFTTKAPGAGTGLGLAMVYGTVTQAGGHVDVESHLGRGTTFSIYLPTADPALLEQAPSPPAPLTRLPGSVTVLVAEDEPELLSLARESLQSSGYRVVTAANGIEALEAFEREPVDLLLTDIVMPQLGGLKLGQLLSEAKPELKIIYMTGYPSRGRYLAGDIPKGAAVLFKPLDPDRLARAVADILADPVQLEAA